VGRKWEGSGKEMEVDRVLERVRKRWGRGVGERWGARGAAPGRGRGGLGSPQDFHVDILPRIPYRRAYYVHMKSILMPVWPHRARRTRNIAATYLEEFKVKDNRRNLNGITSTPREIDPGVAVLEEIHRGAGHVRWLKEKISNLTETELIWGTVMEAHEERTGGQGGDYTLVRRENRATINVWWDMYERERTLLAKISLAAMRAGVEERRVRIAERGVDALEQALAGALTDLGLDPQDPRVRAIMGERLREALSADIFGDGRTQQDRTVDAEIINAPALPRGDDVPAAHSVNDWR